MHTVPLGFRLAGVHCGIKQDAAKEDLTLIVDRRSVGGRWRFTRRT